MTLMESPTQIDFLTGSIAQYPGPILCYRLKYDPLSEDLRQYLKACEVFTGNYAGMNEAFAVVIDASAFCATEANSLDELAAFYVRHHRDGMNPPALVIPSDVAIRLAFENRLRKKWNISEERSWYATFDEALNAAHRLLVTDRRTIL